ncbi:MAG: hypothetical protein HZB26_12255 [Candidatus Hydrogenedentes bacterium]|nr:hypothetical protein [Candidatus Hydrogenedentota bacterium]
MRLSAKVAGIEFVGDEVRVALVRTGGKRPVILEAHAARAKYTDPAMRFDAMVAALKEAVGALKTRPACYILCASGLNGVARILTVPFRGWKRVANAVPFELEPYLAVPIEDMAVDFSIIREVEGKTETLAIAMRHAPLEDQLAALKAAGIDPEGINVDAAGLTALWYGRQTGKVGLTAVVHVRDEGAILAVVQDKVLAYIRHLSVSAARFRANPAAASRDVQNSLRAFLAGWKNDAAVQSICVTGIELSGAEHAAFEQGLPAPVHYENLVDGLKGAEHLPALTAAPLARPQAAQAEAPVDAPVGAVDSEDVAPIQTELTELATPPANLAVDAALAANENNRWEAAIGCAVAAAGGGFDFDFRKGELRRPEAMRGVAIHAAFSSCLALAAVIGYGTYCYLDYRNNVAETERIGQEAWELFQRAFPNSPLAQTRPEKDIGGMITAENFMKEIDRVSTSGVDTTRAVELFQKPTFLDVLAEIAAVMPSGGRAQITSLKLTAGRSPHLEIVGEENDPAAVNEAHEKLKESKVFKVDSDVSHESKDNKNTFKFTAVP